MSTSMLLAGVPLLPTPAWGPWALTISWALVLGTAVLWLGQVVRGRRYWFGALGMVIWTLVPGPVSPAYWLGLAFQSPSIMSVMLCLVWLWLGARRGEPPAPTTAAPLLGWGLWASGVALGWLLLADMLALWPVSVYAWGFSSAALALVCGVAAVVWLAWGSGRSGWQIGVVLGTVVLFVVTRLPSGNVWDAMLDPWLWIGLQLVGLRRLWRWKSRRRDPV